MKYLSVLFLLCFTSVVSAQDSTLVALEAPKLSIGLVEGGSYMHEYVTVKFIKVIQDSRCPKNVMWIRAGEAEVLIGIYKNGLLLEEKSIIVRPNNSPAKQKVFRTIEDAEKYLQSDEYKKDKEVKSTVTKNETVQTVEPVKGEEEDNKSEARKIFETIPKKMKYAPSKVNKFLKDVKGKKEEIRLTKNGKFVMVKGSMIISSSMFSKEYIERISKNERC